MLQVEPKHRIVVSELLTHPWLMAGTGLPVEWKSYCQVRLTCDSPGGGGEGGDMTVVKFGVLVQWFG